MEWAEARESRALGGYKLRTDARSSGETITRIGER